MPARICTQSELEQFPQLEWADVAPRMRDEVRAPIECVLEAQDGGGISRQAWSELANCEGDDLLGLLGLRLRLCPRHGREQAAREDQSATQRRAALRRRANATGERLLVHDFHDC